LKQECNKQLEEFKTLKIICNDTTLTIEVNYSYAATNNQWNLFSSRLPDATNTTAITNIRWCTVTFRTHISYTFMKILLIVTYVNS